MGKSDITIKNESWMCDNYSSPEIEIVEISVEKGFSSSDGGNESYEKEPGVWD
jgi:hypothetical protein